TLAMLTSPGPEELQDVGIRAIGGNVARVIIGQAGVDRDLDVPRTSFFEDARGLAVRDQTHAGATGHPSDRRHERKHFRQCAAEELLPELSAKISPKWPGHDLAATQRSPHDGDLQFVKKRGGVDRSEADVMGYVDVFLLDDLTRLAQHEVLPDHVMELHPPLAARDVPRVPFW